MDTHLTQVSGSEAIDLGSPSLLGLVAALGASLTATVARLGPGRRERRRSASKCDGE